MAKRIVITGVETNHVEHAISVMQLEAEAVLAAAERLDSHFDRAVEMVLATDGKVIALGAGTSGVIARKLAATFTSTGTAALFLHPGDALHGAIGVVDVDDVAVLISNSGETSELLTVLPYLRSRGVGVIALVGNLASSLARQADVVLDAGAEKEACPLDLAPTTTTTVALAMGDALAMAVMAAKGVTAEGFARNHPSGRLGRRLLLKVADLMHQGDENPVVGPDSPWLDVVTELGRLALGAISVVDGSGVLVGIITDGDLRRAVQRTDTRELEHLTAAVIMTTEPVTVTAETAAFDALKLMEQRDSQISVLPVIDGDRRSVGLLRLHDLVRSGL